jgi:ABC-type branched-subunit amino acid transport system ATPase component/ABC-type branched-subunit amino acid transport system permease subunit
VRDLRSRVIVYGAIGLSIVLVKVVLGELASHGVYQFSTPLPVIVLGAIVGMTYGLLGIGLVLIYRTNRIINFAQGQTGAFGAAMFGLIVVRYGVPYWIAFPLGLTVSAGVGVVAETAVVRRLRHAPRLVSVVATLGVGSLLVALAEVINSTASAGSLFPQPSFMPTFSIGALLVTPAYSGMLFLSPLVVVAIAVFLRLSRFGLALRATAANPEAARLAGIFAGRMSSLAWAIAGALSAFSAILTQPTSGFTSAQDFGPSLLLRAMTCAVVGRMESIPIAFTAGIGLGIIEQLLLWNYPSSGLVEATLFVIILVALFVQRPRGGRDEEKGSWAAVQAFRPVSQELRSIWLVRNLGNIVATICVALATLLPLWITNGLAVSFSGIYALSIVGLSVGIVTGLGGQLTLGQFAIAGVGATVSYYVAQHTSDIALAILLAGLCAGIVSLLIGLPALRIRGLMLTVTTLSFALAAYAWLFSQPWALGSGQTPGAPNVFGHRLATGKSYYFFALALLVVCTLLARNVRRSGFGRLLVAVRDNEDNARAFTIPSPRVKMQGFLLAGFLAGVGGAVYANSLSYIGPTTFDPQISIDVVVMTVIGGVSTLAGPILGAFYVLGLPLLPLDSAGLAATQLGALILILQLPGGLASAVEPMRDGIVRWVARRHGVGPQTAPLPVPAIRLEVTVPGTAPDMNGATLLKATNLHKHFGGVLAVQGVSLEVTQGETLGLIGPNGAGKTTTFELIGGFIRPDSGSVVFDHRDITSLRPEQRGQLGLIRSFQDAALFPTLTVFETVKLGLERSAPSRVLSSLVGSPLSEKQKDRRARELVGFMGLAAYRDKQIQELSTGTRRITELACLIATEPKLLLLDEPSSGVAQRETEVLGQLLKNLKSQLGLTLLVIEHDIPLIMGISDRIVAMADGRVICEGTPTVVRSDERVVEAYLGGSISAIERSGVALHTDSATTG